MKFGHFFFSDGVSLIFFRVWFRLHSFWLWVIGHIKQCGYILHMGSTSKRKLPTHVGKIINWGMTIEQLFLFGKSCHFSYIKRKPITGKNKQMVIFFFAIFVQMPNSYSYDGLWVILLHLGWSAGAIFPYVTHTYMLYPYWLFQFLPFLVDARLQFTLFLKALCLHTFCSQKVEYSYV